MNSYKKFNEPPIFEAKDHKKTPWKTLLVYISLGCFMVVFSIGGVLFYFARGLPEIITPSDYHPMLVSQVFATTQCLPHSPFPECAHPDVKENLVEVKIGEFFRERRMLLPYEEIPSHVVHAFLSAEDDRFFEHSGINILSILRAGIANFKAGHIVQGGSTITQQVAKSLLLTPERSYDRKIKEMILAIKLEKNLSKQDILYLYLNQIYLGHGAYGVQAASQAYFRKSVKDLTLAEAAILAGMPQAPSKYSPLINSKKAKERQSYVLKRMVENQVISSDQYQQARSENIRVYQDEDLNAKYSPYLVEYIRRGLVEKFGENTVYEAGLKILVPLDPKSSMLADDALKNGLRAVDKRAGYRGPLGRLSSTDWPAKLASLEQKLIHKKINFSMFTPEGIIDSRASLKELKMDSDLDLLAPNELYEALVLEVKPESAKVSLGKINGKISITQMKWAKIPRDDKNPQLIRNEPNQVQKVLSPGDLIWVSVDPEFWTKRGYFEARQEPIPLLLEQIPEVQGALVSMETQTGNVVAMVGGYDHSLSEFNRVIQAQRQPGSAFKPIIYSAALENGFTPTSIIVDSPLVFKDSAGSLAWKPNNFEEKFYGDTTFRQSFIKSRNIPTIKIVEAITVSKLIDFARRLGFLGNLNSDLSIALGSGTATLMDLTKVYSIFPRFGRKIHPVFFSKIFDSQGKILDETLPSKPAGPTEGFFDSNAQSVKPEAKGEGVAGALDSFKKVAYPLTDDPDQVLDPKIAYLTTHLMKEVVDFGTGHGASVLGRPSAGKTGTTNESIDVWYIGFTPQLITGVWVGYDTQKMIAPGETGAKTALPIWLDYMKLAIEKYPKQDFQVPDGIVFESIDPITGKLAGRSSSIMEAFIEGTQPSLKQKHALGAVESTTEFFKEDRE